MIWDGLYFPTLWLSFLICKMRCWMGLLVLSPGCTWETPGSSWTWIHLMATEAESLQWCPSPGICFKAPQVIAKRQVIYASKSPHSVFQHFFSLITPHPIHEKGELIIHCTSEELWSPPLRLSLRLIKKKNPKVTNQSLMFLEDFSENETSRQCQLVICYLVLINIVPLNTLTKVREGFKFFSF